jgi:hypothetical protein
MRDMKKGARRECGAAMIVESASCRPDAPPAEK